MMIFTNHSAPIPAPPSLQQSHTPQWAVTRVTPLVARMRITHDSCPAHLVVYHARAFCRLLLAARLSVMLYKNEAETCVTLLSVGQSGSAKPGSPQPC